MNSIVLLLSVLGFAAPSPFGPDLNKKLNELSVKRTLKAEWEAARGDQGSSSVNSGVHGLNAYLPAEAVVTRSWLWIDTRPVSDGTGGNGTLAFHCGDAENIKQATDLTVQANNSILEGLSTGASSLFASSVSSGACEVKATVTGSDYTAGKVLLFLDYVVAQ